MAKTAIVTGGGSGLGQSAALRLAQEGINIAVVDISEKSGNDTVQKVKELGPDA
ncbi:SDR family NAD(P)-dependent oxidoreductase, partial [Streptococcus pneumoniae]|nr:SDR family NAD(P)-dependent oxidoreductase [Streptococcus pneumoniae]